jgi:hypothetical protein
MNVDGKTLLSEIKKVIDTYTTRLTVRQIYYQLVSKHLIENVMSQYQRVSKLLVEARHEGEIDWEHIEDRTREAKGGDTELETPEDYFNNILEYLKNCWNYYKKPIWYNQPKYMEVWFEKQALEGIFQKITKQFNVTQLACRGYSSHTMGYELQKRLGCIDDDREIHIVYFGDFDPSGMDIYRFIQDMCERFGLVINFERIAITPEQIKEYNIPPMMAKKSDSRYAGFRAEYGEDVVELDALRPDVLENLIKDAIRKRFDFGIYNKIKEDETKDRELIKTLIKSKLKEGE